NGDAVYASALGVTFRGLAFGPDNNLYGVSGPFANFIYRFCGPVSASCVAGAPLSSAGNKDGLFISFPSSVLALDFGPDGNLYVPTGNSILRFGPDGAPNPAPSGHLVGNVTPNNETLRLLKFAHPGFAPPPPTPSGLALFVADRTGRQLLRYDG